MALPEGILSFSLVLVGSILGISLLIVWIGIPVLVATLTAARVMLREEARLNGDGKAHASWIPLAADQWASGLRDAFTPGSWRALIGLLQEGETYSALLYGLLRLPVGIISFTLAVVLPAVAVGVVLTPLSYIINTEMFSFDIVALEWADWIHIPLLSDMTPFQRSWVASGIGLVLVLLLPPLFRGLGKLQKGWLGRFAGTA